MLLAGDDAAPDSLVAKVADFGLARDFGTALRVQAAKYGTITHMPPELLAEGSLTKVGPLEPMSSARFRHAATHRCSSCKLLTDLSPPADLFSAALHHVPLSRRPLRTLPG